MQVVDLTRMPWHVKGYWPWVPIKAKSMELGNELMGVTDWIPAMVPGGVHVDLYRAGLIKHPWYEQNSLECEWVENRWWVYRIAIDEIDLPDCFSKVEIVCKGIDYEALFYVNDEYLGEHKGMFHPAIFDITQQCRSGGPLIISIIVKHAPDEMAQIGRTSETHTQKSRFNYKWDFSTRLVNIGIWDEVFLQVHDRFSINDVAVATSSNGLLRLSACIEAANNDEYIRQKRQGPSLSLHIRLMDPEGNECASSTLPIGDSLGHAETELHVPKPELWYPNGYGEQPLYQLCLQLNGGGRCLDEQTLPVGFRTLSYEQNDGSSSETLPYTFVVNGIKVYIQGVNITPIDHLYGNVLPEQYTYLVEMMKRAGINMVRVWGGGLIEKDFFYNLCDRCGIMVWQEFIQSSSGVDNVPSKQPQFLALLREAAVASLKRKRNHVSLAVWSGGNELTDASFVPCTYEDENIAMLKHLVETYDPERLFLPTSASGPVEFITKEKGVSHDVHGFWKYLGHPEHYELYGDADHLFHSEFGVDGMSDTKSLHKFLGGTQRVPASMKENLVWRHHGEWWDTLERDQMFFGRLETLESFSDASQWIQAEGLRYILQANKRRQFRNSGSIIWQLNEPYPNVSNTCLIDYYGEAKMAYYWTRQAFRPLHASLDYRKLVYQAGEVMEAPLFCCSNRPGAAKITVSVYDGFGILQNEQHFAGDVGGANTKQIGTFSLHIPETLRGLFMIRLTAGLDNGDRGLPLDYFFSACEEEIYAPAFSLTGVKLESQELGDWEQGGVTNEGLSSLKRSYMIRNTGHLLALHVRCMETTNAFWVEADELYFTLLPGESRKVDITCFRKRAGGFLAEDCNENQLFPEIIFRTFGQKNEKWNMKTKR